MRFEAQSKIYQLVVKVLGFGLHLDKMSKRKQKTLSFFGFTKRIKHRGDEVAVEIPDVIEEEEMVKRIKCLHCSVRFINQTRTM